MGMFLSLSGVIGQTQDQVLRSLTNYTKSVQGGLQLQNLTMDDNNCCVIQESKNNTTIIYPNGYLEWDRSSEFISRELGAPVFSFHIHDGDLWMYILYVNGQVVDQFNPIPDYWDENIGEEEIQSWKGNASTIAKYIPGLSLNDIDKYLVRWDLDDEESSKAYEEDQFANEDWQLLDFMRKCGLSYPLDEDGSPTGQTYSLWTHVSDLKFWQSEAAKTYSITSIPFSILLDPNGVIIDKNLRGPALDRKLSEIFDKK